MIEKISVGAVVGAVVVVDVVGAAAAAAAVWGDSGGIERHRTSCADRTGSHKRSFLVGDAAGTYIGHPKTWVGRREGVVVVASRKGGWVVQCPMPRPGRSRRADAFVARRRVGRGGERRCWKLGQKNVSGGRREMRMRKKQSEGDRRRGWVMTTLTGHDAVRDAITMRCGERRAQASAGCAWVVCVCVCVGCE